MGLRKSLLHLVAKRLLEIFNSKVYLSSGGEKKDAEWIKGAGGLGKSSVEHRPLPEHVSLSGARE